MKGADPSKNIQFPIIDLIHAAVDDEEAGLPPSKKMAQQMP